MKIRISHISNTYNNGSLMMAINTIEYIYQNVNETNEVIFFTDALGENNLQRIKNSVSCSKIFGIPQNTIPLNSFKKKIKQNISIYLIIKLFYKPVRLIKNVLELLLCYFTINNKLKKENCEVLIVLGGDDFSPYYGYFQLFKSLFEIKLYSKKIPIVLLGQTIGPFGTVLRRIVKWCLQDCYISIREESNFNYVKDKINLNQVTLSGDLAFLNLPFQNKLGKKDFLLTQYQLTENEYISLVPSGLMQAYTKNEKKYIENYVNVINFLTEYQETKNYKIILLAHVLLNDEIDDKMIIQKIYSSLGEKIQKKVVLVLEPLLPYELRILLGNGLFTITGRMHSAISTFQKGKPAICLSYSIKYSGVIGKELNMQDLIIECSGAKYWDNNYVSRKIADLVQDLLKSYESIRSLIAMNIPNLQSKIKNEINDLCSFLLKIQQKG